MIPDDKIEEVREAADIVDVVSDHVKLRRTGSNFMGLCPFHNEKTPSFNVSPNLGIYKCFGCGEAGDVFSFVMNIDGVGFEEAVRSLAERYNIVIPEKSETYYDPQQFLKDGIYHALRFAGNFFHQILAESDEAEQAREYLKKRGYPWKTVRKYGIGYAPDRFDGLLNSATDAGINLQYLHESGLVKARDDDSGYYDTFRGRLMFPIFNPSGKVIAFGGRTLSSAANIPKYINSPQTPVYNKSEVLYGIHVAKNEIRKAGEVILVEGYTDVITMQQAGIGNVVSTSGTSLTTGQIRVMKRYGDVLLMIFDADTAGVRAAVRGISIALLGGMGVRVLTLPEGEDPDSFVRGYGAEAFLEIRKKETVDFLRFLVHLARREDRWDDPVERRRVITEMLEAIAVVPDEISRANYIQELNSISRIGDRALLHELETIRNRLERSRRRMDEKKAFRADRQREDAGFSRTTGPAASPGPAGGHGQAGGHGEHGRHGHPGSDPHPGPDHPGHDPVKMAQPGRSQAGSVQPGSFAPDTNRPARPTRRPEYEKELIRLMLTFGERLIVFIGSHCGEVHFEDPELQEFYADILRQYHKGDPVSVDTYSRREHPYPGLVGEIVLQRHWVSELGMRKRGVIIHRDADPVNTARGALKSLKIRYFERKKDEFLDRYAAAPEEEKKEIQQWLKKANEELKRHRTETTETLFPEL
jgi:DNA primase